MSNLHDAMIAVGMEVPLTNAKSTKNSFKRYGKNNRYWVKFFDGGAIFGDHVTGESHHWFEWDGKPVDAKKIAERKAMLAQLRKQQKQEEERLHAEEAKNCEQLWNAMPETGKSAYLERKQVGAFGVRYHSDCLVIPLRDVAGKLWNLQYIKCDGTKRFSAGGRKRGFFHTIGQISDTVIIGEGYATLASIHMATGATCIVAFDAGNLEPVIELLTRKYPDLAITIAADDDRWKPELRNTGREKASDAARRFGCTVMLPLFKACTSKPTDWNDLHVLEGLDVVKSQLAEMLPC